MSSTASSLKAAAKKIELVGAPLKRHNERSDVLSFFIKFERSLLFFFSFPLFNVCFLSGASTSLKLLRASRNYAQKQSHVDGFSARRWLFREVGFSLFRVLVWQRHLSFRGVPVMRISGEHA